MSINITVCLCIIVQVLYTKLIGVMGLILSGAWIYALKCVDIKIIFEIAICIRISPCCRHYVILPWANLANYMICWSFPCLIFCHVAIFVVMAYIKPRVYHNRHTLSMVSCQFLIYIIITLLKPTYIPFILTILSFLPKGLVLSYFSN